MERAIQVQFLAFSTKHDLLSDYQSGSRKKHSTETALVYLTDYIVEHMDGQMITGEVFIELKKAFDLVCQDNPTDPIFRSLETFLQSFQLSDLNEMQSKIT